MIMVLWFSMSAVSFVVLVIATTSSVLVLLLSSSKSLWHHRANYDADAGLLNVTADNDLCFVGLLCFSPDVELNLRDDLIGGFKWPRNSR
jgi:hypothetical protein